MGEEGLQTFIRQWNSIMPIIAREITRRQENELYRGKITLPQFLILEYVQREGGAKMTDVAGFVNVTTAAATGLVDRLVRGGYVQRLHDVKDRRVVKIAATPKGHEVLKRINVQRQQIASRVFGKITREEREEYLRILLRIQDILLKENGG